ncbi:hypothetical protein ACOZE3_28665 [Streptomyces cinereoruber]|uniref:hypothetical protein n=1 Tax=Streptomyces cinereoruber TaxID=67260 RepID=UPI003BF49CE4
MGGVVTILLGGLAWLGLWTGLYGVIRARRERRLRRCGVTVTATRATMSRGGGGGTSNPDATGTYRGFLHGEAGPTITAIQPPEDPADVLVPMPPFTHLVGTYAGAFLVFCSGVMVVLHAVMALIFFLDG